MTRNPTLDPEVVLADNVLALRDKYDALRGVAQNYLIPEPIRMEAMACADAMADHPYAIVGNCMLCNGAFILMTTTIDTIYELKETPRGVCRKDGCGGGTTFAVVEA